jgi:GAF domain-containing protein
MEPVPESLEAVLLLNLYSDNDVGLALGTMGRRALELVPSLVGLSLTTVDDDLTFTLVGSNPTATDLDVAQYLEDGPCLHSVREAQTVATDQDSLLDEERWRLFAIAGAAAGIASTLSLPIHRGGRVIGGINLYAAVAEAFHGRHEQLADALGGTAAEAVTNADLSFSTRLRAAEAPEKIRHREVINHAEGALAEMHGIDIATAAGLLREAAARADITAAQAAKTFLRLLRRGN